MIRTIFALCAFAALSFSQTGTTAAEQGITYEQFQAMHKTELRSVEKFKEAIKPIEKELVDFWKNMPVEFKRDTASVLVNALGVLQSFNISFPKPGVYTDTSFLRRRFNYLNQIETLLKKVSMPALQDSSFICSYNIELQNQSVVCLSPEKYRPNGLIGARSKAPIMRAIQKTMPEIKYLYNRYLHEYKEFGDAKVTILWTISSSGQVVSCSVFESAYFGKSEQLPLNIRHSFEQGVVEIIQKIDFGAFDKPDDLTSVIYPFVFTR